MRSFIAGGLLAASLSLSVNGQLAAQDDPPVGWFDVAELTFVMTAGNATSSTMGFKNTLDYRWPNASWQLAAGGVRTESGTTVRTATGTPTSFSVSETTDTEKTAENYFLRSRYDRKLSEAAYVFGGAGWDRNTFAGIQNRVGLVSGAGRTWFDAEDRRLKTDVGLTYTFQDDVVENPAADDGFIGLRAAYDFFKTLSATTNFTSVLVVDENLQETSDLRADWTNAIAVAMSDNLALKTSLQLLFDNEPALVEVPLGSTTVLTPLGKTDSVFTVAIVASF